LFYVGGSNGIFLRNRCTFGLAINIGPTQDTSVPRILMPSARSSDDDLSRRACYARNFPSRSPRRETFFPSAVVARFWSEMNIFADNARNANAADCIQIASQMRYASIAPLAANAICMPLRASALAKSRLLLNYFFFPPSVSGSAFIRCVDRCRAAYY